LSRATAATIVFIALALVAVAPARGDELHHTLSFAGGGELYGSPGFNGHGFGLIRYDLVGLPRHTHFSAELNSDTLRLAYDGLRFGPVELGFTAAGEVHRGPLERLLP
jgi:hypothetical protein